MPSTRQSECRVVVGCCGWVSKRIAHSEQMCWVRPEFSPDLGESIIPARSLTYYNLIHHLLSKMVNKNRLAKVRKPMHQASTGN
jgi:hypothetical protein